MKGQWNNGYYNSALLPYDTNYVVLTSAPDYQLGPLGSYYYPTNGGNLSLLTDAGSRSAAAVGLCDFTAQTNQSKDTATVDIGFHYVALATKGNPDDYDADGLPDHVEDRNGNGLVDTGETDWQNASDFGLRVFITEPKANSILP